ncbi:unnamed protein product [Sphagnum tenellum]
MKPSQYSRNYGAHALIFGEAKSGKSTLVSKLMLQGYKLWWFSLDNGHEIVYKLGLSEDELDQRLELFVIPDTYSFPVAFQTIRAVSFGKEVLICDSHGQAGCSTCKKLQGPFSRICLEEFGPKDIWVIDHAGQLTQSALNRLTRDLSEEKRELYKPSFTDYMNLGTMLDSILSNIQQSRANIIVITHTIESELEDGAKKLVPHIGTGNFSRNSPKYFSHVIYTKVSNKNHKVGSATTYETNVITGSRSDIRIEDMKVPDLAPFFDRQGKLAEKRLDQPKEQEPKLLTEAQLQQFRIDSRYLLEFQSPTETEQSEMVTLPGLSSLEAVETKISDTVKQAETKAAGIIRTAAQIVEGIREQQHGEKERSFTLIAKFWTSYLEGRKTNGPVTPTDVAQLMVLFKIARTIQGEAILDHFVDQAGYSGIAGELSQMQKKDTASALSLANSSSSAQTVPASQEAGVSSSIPDPKWDISATNTLK